VIGVFQPHLFTRTRDFVEEFAQVLSSLDEVALLPIYPAREKPIEGVTSEWLMEMVSSDALAIARVVEKTQLVEHVTNIVELWAEPCVVMTLGAGDIDRLVQDIKQNLNKYE
jgi:UDP-N-acetylmuramate--alanine ligase